MKPCATTDVAPVIQKEPMDRAIENFVTLKEMRSNERANESTLQFELGKQDIIDYIGAQAIVCSSSSIYPPGAVQEFITR